MRKLLILMLSLLMAFLSGILPASAVGSTTDNASAPGLKSISISWLELQTMRSRYFKDDICSQLKDGITESDENSISNDYIRQLVHTIRTTNYSTKYRVGEFEAYRPLADLQSELCTNSQYSRYENPTGIYFEQGEELVLFVDGISNADVSLIIKSFGENRNGENHPESTYSLKNGANVITTKNRGNGYISYYTSSYASAPKVKIHFAMATENGYFDLQRGDTNADWESLLANAKSDIIDVRTERMQVAVPLNTVKRVTPRKGVELATIYDNVIKHQHEIMGLEKYGRKPKNRQFARPSDSGMFADGIGAAASFDSFSEWCNADNFGYWGFGHELGHNNQVYPGAKWDGCGETTNNIYASWVEHKLGNGYHRLEDENIGIDAYSGWRGGRFQAYLEEGVRKGVSWFLQDGPDYHGVTPNTVTVDDEDYNGKATGTKVTTTSRNYDHFVKVIPLYQLALWTQDAGKSPDAYGAVFESIRVESSADRQLSNGQLQVKFMKRFCDATKLNLLPFFEKAGMFKPVNAYIEDYTSGWLKINQAMLDELKAYVESKGYADAPEALNYLNAYNLNVFRNEAKLVGNTVNAGCTVSGTKVIVDHSKWQNVVGFETYNAKGELIHISTYGLGAAQKSKDKTWVLFPAEASYIMAVGYDGKRVKCFQRTITPGSNIPLPRRLNSLDEVEADKTYVLFNKAYHAYLTYNANYSTSQVWTAEMVGGDAGHQLKSDTYAEDLDVSDAGSSWMVVREGNGVKLYNLGAKKYMVTPPDGEVSAACVFTDEATALQLVELGDGRFAFSATGKATDYVCAAPQLDFPVSNWTSSDAGAAWELRENPNVDADISILPFPPVAEKPLGEQVFSLEDLDMTKAYVLYNPTFTAYAIYNELYSPSRVWTAEMTGGDADHQLSNQAYAEDLDVSDAGSSWMVLRDEDGVKLYNLGAGRYLTTPNNAEASSPCTFAEEPVVLQPIDLGNGRFAFSASGETNDYMCAAPQMTFPISTWASSDAGAAWELYVNPNVEVDTSLLPELPGGDRPLGAKVTSLDNIDMTKTYVLYNPTFTAYAIYNGTHSTSQIWTAGMIGGDASHQLSNQTYAEPLDITDAGSSWMVMKKDGNTYLYNMGAQKYLNTPVHGGESKPCTFSDAPVALHVVAVADGNFAFSASGDEKDFMCAAPQMEFPISIWTSDDSGAAWGLYENPNIEADLSLLNNVTGIDGASTAGNAPVGVFTVSGMKLNVADPKQLPAGLYIVNGKKTLIRK